MVKLTVTSSLTFYDNGIFWILKLQELEETPDLCIADPKSVWLDTTLTTKDTPTTPLED